MNTACEPTGNLLVLAFPHLGLGGASFTSYKVGRSFQQLHLCGLQQGAAKRMAQKKQLR